MHYVMGLVAGGMILLAIVLWASNGDRYESEPDHHCIDGWRIEMPYDPEKEMYGWRAERC